MKNAMLKRIVGSVLVIAILAIFAHMQILAQDEPKQANNVKAIVGDDGLNKNLNRPGVSQSALEGSWTVQVTIRNCQTGAAIRTFPRLSTFMQGGTMQETAAAGTPAAPALRSPGHGVWEQFNGQNYYYALQFLRLNADGSPAGSVRERRYLTLHILRNSFEATGTGDVFDAAGNLLITTCATETGARFL